MERAQDRAAGDPADLVGELVSDLYGAARRVAGELQALPGDVLHLVDDLLQDAANDARDVAHHHAASGGGRHGRLGGCRDLVRRHPQRDVRSRYALQVAVRECRHGAEPRNGRDRPGRGGGARRQLAERGVARHLALLAQRDEQVQGEQAHEEGYDEQEVEPGQRKRR